MRRCFIDRTKAVDIADRLKKVRKKLDLSQKQVALSVGVTQTEIQKLEAMNMYKKLHDVFHMICDEHGISVIWVLTGIGDMFYRKSENEYSKYKRGSVVEFFDCDLNINEGVVSFIEGDYVALFKVIPLRGNEKPSLYYLDSYDVVHISCIGEITGILRDE